MKHSTVEKLANESDKLIAIMFELRMLSLGRTVTKEESGELVAAIELIEQADKRIQNSIRGAY